MHSYFYHFNWRGRRKYGNVPPQLQAYWISGKLIFVLCLKSFISTFIPADVKGSGEIAMQCARCQSLVGVENMGHKSNGSHGHTGANQTTILRCFPTSQRGSRIYHCSQRSLSTEEQLQKTLINCFSGIACVSSSSLISGFVSNQQFMIITCRYLVAHGDHANNLTTTVRQGSQGFIQCHMIKVTKCVTNTNFRITFQQKSK